MRVRVCVCDCVGGGGGAGAGAGGIGNDQLEILGKMTTGRHVGRVRQLASCDTEIR